MPRSPSRSRTRSAPRSSPSPGRGRPIPRRRSRRRPSKVSGKAGIRDAALKFLARREHGTEELRRKLCRKGYAPGEVRELTDALVREGLLSDMRYVEAYHRSRVRRGWGPLRIRAELREHGVDDTLIDDYVDVNADYWRDVVRAARAKRFGAAPPGGFDERAKQSRYLQSRGFTAEQVGAAVRSARGDDEDA